MYLRDANIKKKVSISIDIDVIFEYFFDIDIRILVSLICIELHRLPIDGLLGSTLMIYKALGQ